MNDQINKALNAMKGKEETKKEDLTAQKHTIDYNKLKKEITSGLTSWNIVGELLTTFLMAIMTLILIGAPTLFDGKFDWSMYGEMSFWSRYITTQIASWFTRIWVYSKRRNNHKKNHTEYKRSYSMITLFTSYDYKVPYIDVSVDKDLKNRKTTAWKNLQKSKLLKYIKKYELTNVVESLNAFQIVDFKGVETFYVKSNISNSKNKKSVLNSLTRSKKRWEKKLIKISFKIQTIFYSMSTEYIEQNFDNIKVKFNNVSRSILQSGIKTPNESLIGYNYDKRTVSTFIKEFIPTFLMFSSISFLLIPLIKGSSFVKDANAWINFGISLSIVVFSGMSIIFTSEDMFERTDLRSILSREATLKKYYEQEIGSINIDKLKEKL